MKIYIAKADDDNGEVSFGKLEARETNLYYIVESISEESAKLLGRQRRFIKKREVDRASDWCPFGEQFGLSKNTAVRGIVQHNLEDITLMQKAIEQLESYIKKCKSQYFYIHKDAMFYVRIFVNGWHSYYSESRYDLEIAAFIPRETPMTYKCDKVIMMNKNDSTLEKHITYKSWYWKKKEIDKPLEGCFNEGTYSSGEKAAKAIIDYCNTEIAILKYSIKKKERIIKQCEGFVAAA